MRLLLDTCTFLWVATDSPRLSRTARDLFAEPDNEFFLSVASSWEIAIKASLGKLSLPEPPSRYVPSRRRAYGVNPLPIDEESVLHVPRLPMLHTDPFDRLLACQSILHGLPLLTPDPLISQYAVRVLW